MTETGIVKYDVTDAAIAQMGKEYMLLTVKDMEDEAGFTLVHEARMTVKTHRVAVEKRRKALKADALAWGKKVDGEAKRITALLAPIEAHLTGEEKKITDEKESIKQEKIKKENESWLFIDGFFANNNEKGIEAIIAIEEETPEEDSP